MRALRNLITPPSSPSISHLDDSESILTEELSLGTPEFDDFDTTDAEDTCDVVKSTPRAPVEEIAKPVERKNTDGSARSADDLLAQLDVLRGSANAARSRRPQFRGERPPYDRKNDDLEHGTSTPSCGPGSSREPGLLRAMAYFPASSVSDDGILPGSTHGEVEAYDAYRSNMHRLPFPSAVPEYTPTIDEEKRTRKKFFRSPIPFFKRFLCLGHFDGTGQLYHAEFHSPVDHFDSHFDSLLRIDTLTTRRIRPRLSVVSPCVIDIH